jgi:glutamyl-tRNA synthetase
MPRMQPCSRLAPSPTGPLHLGNACTFLVNWALARNLGWRLVLRIEDLDRDRAAAAGDTGTLEALEWLGIDHDGEAVRQSERLPSFERAMRTLADAGLAYESPQSRSEVREAALALGAPHASDAAPPFPASLRPPPGAAWGFARTDVNHRLRVDPGAVRVDDEVAGARTFEPAREGGDFLVWTKAGFPSYQLAVTVDDIAQGVTDVVRGDDLLPSAALQSILHRALGHGPPRWWHLPLVLDADGRRMAKRDGALSLASLRAAGTDPARVRGLAAAWTGAIPAPRPLSPEGFRALIDPDTLRAWHRRAQSAPPRLEDGTTEWLHGSR